MSFFSQGIYNFQNLRNETVVIAADHKHVNISHLKMKEHFDSNYEEQKFLITRDSFNACFFLFGVELFSKYTKVASKMCSTMLADRNGHFTKSTRNSNN